MNERSAISYSASTDAPVIVTVRGQKVVLDSELARIYGVRTKALNQAIKRNREKFPADFMFQLTYKDLAEIQLQHAADKDDDSMRSQIVTAWQKRNTRFVPYAFTEHGAIMAATVLDSPRAVQMSVFVVRAFVKMRSALMDSQHLAMKLAALEREVKARLDTHDAAIVDILRRIMDIIDPPALPEPPRQGIGFRVREKKAVYRVSRRTKKHQAGLAEGAE
ncbi:MAG: DNA-binding protein [Verrucomicrobia bacterium]|nr:DNA-binding protein [Verrucomicrobiota bacterium]